MYKIKEIHFTIQGEGFHAGRPAIFCRFSGCNLWSGREEDRHKAICKFCDTDFWGTDGTLGGKYTSESLSQKLFSLWPTGQKNPFVVFTGGEPLLQLDAALINELKTLNFEIALETNGTIAAPKNIDWICVSPKEGTDILLKEGNELKLVYPQGKMNPQTFESWNFDHHFLQPMDGPNTELNTKICMDYCKSNPFWNLSIQLHKILNIP